MSDLISKEALIKELNELRRYVPFPSSKDVFDIIMKAKAINSLQNLETQGEQVAYLYRCQHKQPNPKYTEWACVSNNAHRPVDQWQSYEVLPLYTTPQQPQEQDDIVKKAVADALEDAAKEIDLMVNTYIESGNKYHEVSEGRERCVNKARAAMSCAETIRAFIKRKSKE